MINPIGPAPTPLDSAADFNTKAFGLLAQLPGFVDETNATADTIQINADILAAVLLGMAFPEYTGTSASSVTVGTGPKVFATQTGKLWVPGQIVVVNNGSNIMRGPVVSYTGSNLTVNVTSTVGSGTFSSWTIGLTFDGLLLAKAGANADITDLNALLTVPTVIASAISAAVNATPTVRQTVLSGPVDTNGFAAFGGSTGSTTVTAAGTLVATAASGTSNRTGSITNPSWTGLSTNGTMYLYLDIAANGVCTPGSTALAPTYRWGGADVVAAGQSTFNIQEMQMKVGNGSTAAQTFRVFVGEVTVAGGVVSAINWYALQGRYQSAWVATLPAAGAAVSLNHNIGTVDLSAKLEVQCTTAEFGYSVGDTVTDVNGNTGGVAAPISIVRTNKAVGFTVTPTGSLLVLNKTTGANATMTLANWRYRMTAQRGW